MEPSEHPAIEIGFVGKDRKIARLIVEALMHLGSVRTFDIIDRADRLDSLEVLIMELSEPIVEGLKLFAAVHRHRPALPIILLAEDMTAELVAEFLNCGATDFHSLPFNAETLAFKVQRAAKHITGPTIDIEGLGGPIRPDPPPPPPVEEVQSIVPPTASLASGSANQRRVYRATVQREVTAWTEVKDERVHFKLRDVSIPQGKNPGGMQLQLDERTATRLAIDDWFARSPEFDLHLSIDPEGEPIKLRARVVAKSRPGTSRARRFAVQYRAYHRADEGRLWQFWVECQRKSVD